MAPPRDPPCSDAPPPPWSRPGEGPPALTPHPQQVMLQLEKKLFDYFNQEVFRDDNGTAVSPAMGCAVGPPPLLWAVLTPGPPITSGWALPGVPPASGQAASTCLTVFDGQNSP